MQDRSSATVLSLPDGERRATALGVVGRGLAGVRTGRKCVWLLLAMAAGCGGQNPGQVQAATDTDGVVTTSVDGGEQGVDETGVQAPNYCIYNNDNSDLAGVKHQCNLEYDLEVTFTVSPLGGADFQVPLSVIGVLTASDESTYEHPFVMACCTDIRDASGWPFADTCDTYQHKACMSDFIQHVCSAPGNWLAASADDFLGNGKEAIQGAAKWLNDHRQDCYDHFWQGSDSLFDADYCSTEFDGFFDHTPWEPSESFQYTLPLSDAVLFEVSNIVVAPHSSFGQNVPLEPPTPADSCSNPDGNNGEVPPLSTVEPVEESFAPVAPVPIEVIGPALAGELITGTGVFDTGSMLQWTTNRLGALELERWVMTEAGATSVGTSSIRASVDHFKLALVRPVTAKATTSGWHIDPTIARFALSATVDSNGYDVQATNSTSIELHEVTAGEDACPTQFHSCVVTDPFTIVHEDEAGQSWKLSIPAITWQL